MNGKLPTIRFKLWPIVLAGLMLSLVALVLHIFMAGWAYGSSVGNDILTPQERLWLAQNQKRIVLAVETGYAPFVFIDRNGQPGGLAHDYMRELEEKLGVKFNERRFPSLDDIFVKVRNGEVQIVNAITKTPWRSSFLNMTDPFVSVPNVIITRKDRPGQITEQNLSGLTVSLVNSYAVTEYLTTKGLVPVPDLAPDDLTALLNVSFGRSDAAVIDLATASYLISQQGITNLRVAGEASFDIRLSMGTPLNEPVLYGILQKGLGAITDAERQEIHDHWINASNRSILTDWRFWVTVGGGILVIGAVIVGILVWNRTLRKQVALHAAALVKEQAQFHQKLERQIAERTAALRTTTNRLEQVLDAAGEGIYGIDAENRLTFANRAAAELLGWPSPGSMLGLTGQQATRHLLADGRPCTEGGCPILQTLADGEVRRVHDEFFARADGTRIPVEYVAAPHVVDGRVVGAVVIFGDVSQHRAAEQALRERQEIFEQMFMSGSAIKLLIDPADGRMVDVNPAAAEFYGYPLEQLRQMTIFDINTLPPDDAKARMKQACEQERGYVLMEHRLADGSVRSVESYAGPLRLQGRASFFL